MGADLSREDRRRELIEEVTAILSENLAAAHAIAAEDPAWGPVLERQGTEGLAQKLCTSSSWRHVVKAFDEAHRKSCKAGDAQAEAIVEIVRRVLPEIYASTELFMLPGDGGGHLVTLPVETKTLAEIAMAAFDARELRFGAVESRGRYPVGDALLELADDQAETGFDFKQDLAFREWILLLAQWLDVDEDDVRKLRRPERFDELLPLLNFQVEREVTSGEPRRYFLFTSRFRETHHLFLDQIRRNLPALHLVELAAKTWVEERMASAPLQNILFRSFQTRNSSP